MRASDGRQFVPPSDVGDAPALGPRFLQLRVLAADDRVHAEAVGAGQEQVDLATDQPPSDGSYLAKIYKYPYDREKDRDGIVVRVIRYTLDDPQRVGHGEEHMLITNLFDEDLSPAMELILLYHERWEEEQVFDEQKTHQDPRRATKPAQVRSETPAGVIQEIYALSLGHFVIRSLMFEAAATVGLDADRLSFTGCFQILKCRLPECDGKTAASFEAWYQGLLWELPGVRTELRRNRINPRVIKRKMSKWKKKRPEHRHLPPLKKTFAETVVMTR